MSIWALFHDGKEIWRGNSRQILENKSLEIAAKQISPVFENEETMSALRSLCNIRDKNGYLMEWKKIE